MLSSGMLIFALASCGGPATTSTLNPPTTESVDEVLKPTNDISSNVGFKAGRHVFHNYMAARKDYNEGMYTNFGEAFFPSYGHAKLLVVPVVFSDNASTPEKLAANKETMRKIFFGAPEETTWQSVSSYYYQSSYHQLHIEGDVVDTVKLDKTYETYTSSKTAAIYNDIVEEVYDKLFTADGAPLKGKEADFDSNGDGVIDGIYMVPDSHINHDDGGSLGWAFTTRHGFKTKLAARKNPQWANIGTYCWTSIDFSQETASDKPTLEKPDAHTFIHEMGHQLGLADYYDPNNQGSSTAGGSTMQDQNICDHDIYSKYLWGWTDMQAVTSANTEATISITLKPSNSSGQALLIADTWNGTSLDEYLLLEYYTPEGLNAHDTAKYYASKDQIGPDGEGIRIWHVDKTIHEAHMAKKDKDSIVYFDPNGVTELNTLGEAQDYRFPDDISPEDDELYNEDPDLNEDDDFYYSMTTNNSENHGEFYVNAELTLMRADKGEKTVGVVMTKDSLFGAGSSFGATGDKYADFEFYNPAVELDYSCSDDDFKNAAKKQLPYSIHVDSIGNGEAKLTLTKK
jgi:M6 family metalloprotease-like protein